MIINVLVVGAGAIGCLVGGRLAAIGCQVTLLGRRSWVSAINAEGLQVQWPGEAPQTVHPQAIEALAELDSWAEIDLVLVTPKSFATAAVVDGLAERLPATARVLSLQNGVGNEELLASLLPQQTILAGSITLPVMVPQAGTIIVSKVKGGIGLAPFSTGAEVADVAAILRQAGFTVATYEDHRSLKWSKLLMNLIGNATSAILDMPPGESLKHPEIFDIEIDAMRETLTVMRAQGISVVPFPDYPLTWLAFVLRWLPKPVLRPLLRSAMVGGRGDKLPSLQLDLRSGRNESEVVVLNGVIARSGPECGVSVPVNTELYQILSGIVLGEIDWDIYREKPHVLWQAIDAG